MAGGWGGGAAQPRIEGLAVAWGWQARRGARPPSTLYPLPLLPQRLGISFHKLLWGHLFPSSKSLCHLLPPPSWVEGGADPRAGRGEGTAGQMDSSAPRGPPGLLVSGIETMAFSFLGEPLSESTAPLPVLSPLLLFIGINLGTSSFHSSDFPHHSSLGLAFSSSHCRPSSQETLPRAAWPKLRRAAGPGASALHGVGGQIGQGPPSLLTSAASVGVAGYGRLAGGSRCIP